MCQISESKEGRNIVLRTVIYGTHHQCHCGVLGFNCALRQALSISVTAYRLIIVQAAEQASELIDICLCFSSLNTFCLKNNNVLKQESKNSMISGKSIYMVAMPAPRLNNSPIIYYNNLLSMENVTILSMFR